MGFFKRLFGGGERAAPDDRGLHLYIKCNRCGSPVHVRIDPSNDLSAADYDDDAAEGYIVRKEAVDERCFRRMQIEMQFDSSRNEISREITGGTFIGQDEYASLVAARNAGKTASTADEEMDRHHDGTS